MRRVLPPIVMLVLCAALLFAYRYFVPPRGGSAASPTMSVTPTLDSIATAEPTATQPAPPSASLLPAIGEPAPDFTLPSASGAPITLSGYRGQKDVVLLFYRTGG